MTHNDGEKERALAVAEKHIVRADRFESLLREARDLLWHGEHRDIQPCQGCDLEARIDTALNDGRA